MTSFFQELFTYTHFCNTKTEEIFATHPDKVSDKAILLFSHVLNAHHIWNHRILGLTPEYTVWQLQQAVDFKSMIEKNHSTTLRILENTSLDKVLDYKISTGQPFQNTVQDILFHMINHSTYHRAQIATEFKNHGINPPISDYIFYKR
ncbi:MAG: DinB family protein [Cytophagaceae bacterium]